MNVVYQTASGNEMLIKNLDCDFSEKIFLSNDLNKDEILDFLKIVNSLTSPKSLLGEAYDNMQKSLCFQPDEMFLSIPKTCLDVKLKHLTEDLQSTLNDLENKEYLVTYLTIKRFLSGLSRPLIDKQKLKTIISSEEHDSVKALMLSLSPDSNGLAEKTGYSMTGSSTGRLIVNKGPNILTMKASARSSIKSRYKNGKILQVDISAAEPNIALNVCGKPIVKDIYAHISKEVLQSRVTRDNAKLIVLCALYGQSPKKLQKLLPDDINSRQVIQKCRDFFDAPYLERFLELSHRNNNLRNVVGRPINLNQTDKRLLVSYYLQSSAAELAIVLFSDMCDTLKRSGQNLTPLYVIHDAIILDCDEILSSKFLAENIVNLQMGKWKFHAKVTEI